MQTSRLRSHILHCGSQVPHQGSYMCSSTYAAPLGRISLKWEIVVSTTSPSSYDEAEVCAVLLHSLGKCNSVNPSSGVHEYRWYLSTNVPKEHCQGHSTMSSSILTHLAFKILSAICSIIFFMIITPLGLRI